MPWLGAECVLFKTACPILSHGSSRVGFQADEGAACVGVGSRMLWTYPGMSFPKHVMHVMQGRRGLRSCLRFALGTASLFFPRGHVDRSRTALLAAPSRHTFTAFRCQSRGRTAPLTPTRRLLVEDKTTTFVSRGLTAESMSVRYVISHSLMCLYRTFRLVCGVWYLLRDTRLAHHTTVDETRRCLRRKFMALRFCREDLIVRKQVLDEGP